MWHRRCSKMEVLEMREPSSLPALWMEILRIQRQGGPRRKISRMDKLKMLLFTFGGNDAIGTT